MENYFDEPNARRYDDDAADMFDPAVLGPTVDFLADLADLADLAGFAGDRRALEFGIGTGRVALPLRARGVDVAGVEFSEAMVVRLRAKPGGDRVGVTMGDFASTRVPGTFTLVYLVYNTIGNLTSQDAQVACFRNAAAHLRPGGYFVIEVGVPQLQRLPPGDRVRAFTVEDTHLGFDEYDIANQGLISHHYSIGDGTVDVISIPFRYVWPAELDLMAQLAGMVLDQRYSDWDRSPFTSDSMKHVSVWKKVD